MTNSLAFSIWSPVNLTAISSQSNKSNQVPSFSSTSAGGTTSVCCNWHRTVLSGRETDLFEKFFTSTVTRDDDWAKLRTHGDITKPPGRADFGSSVTTVILPLNTGKWTIPSTKTAVLAGTVNDLDNFTGMLTSGSTCALRQLYIPSTDMLCVTNLTTLMRQFSECSSLPELVSLCCSQHQAWPRT